MTQATNNVLGAVALAMASGRIRVVDLTQTLTPEFPQIALPPEIDPPILVAALVGTGIRVSAFAPVRRSLEDLYLEITSKPSNWDNSALIPIRTRRWSSAMSTRWFI